MDQKQYRVGRKHWSPSTPNTSHRNPTASNTPLDGQLFQRSFPTPLASIHPRPPALPTTHARGSPWNLCVSGSFPASLHGAVPGMEAMGSSFQEPIASSHLSPAKPHTAWPLGQGADRFSGLPEREWELRLVRRQEPLALTPVPGLLDLAAAHAPLGRRMGRQLAGKQLVAEEGWSSG